MPFGRSTFARMHLLIALAVGLATTPAAAEFPRFFRGLAAPFRAAHRDAPPLPADPCLDELAGEVAWLEHHVNHYGSIVAKSPDVWGQNRLTRHRDEYEDQMRAQLARFESRSSAALRRSDQAFLGMALALQSASGNRRRGDQVAVPEATGSASVINSIQGLLPSTNEAVNRADSAVIARTAPFMMPAVPAGVSFGDEPLGLEPTLHLDQLSRYLNHLNQLRRINEGDDSADSPGYSLNLVRVPVSITPGDLTRKGHGAEITFIAEPILGDDLLPTTFRNLVINDLVDIIAPALTWAVNDPECLAWAATILGDDAGPPQAALPPEPDRRQGVMAAMQALSARLPAVAPTSVPAVQTRRARLPIPFSQLADVSGIRQIAILIRDTRAALEHDPANRPCITYVSVRGHLLEELRAAYDFLAIPAHRHVWQELPGWNLPALVRGRDAAQLGGVRCRFFTSVAAAQPGGASDGSWLLPTPDGSADAVLMPDADLCCGQPQPAVPVCRTTTAVLAWGILVESALLDQRLIEDIRESATSLGRPCPATDFAGPFYGPDPSPEARAAFAEYVRTRWPIRVFALDPAVEEQNVDETYSRRRELQIAMALAAASGRLNGQALTRYTRRLETDLATVSLNRTIVGFSHGSDTFGWRFYPRVQAPPTRGTLATLGETLRGGPTTDGELMQRQLEPGMRECSAIVVMPSFVPHVRLDCQSRWFSLVHPRAVVPDARESVKLARSVEAIRRSGDCCGQCQSDAAVVADLQRAVDRLSRRLPTQALTALVPYENTAGGFELFNTGITDLAPELLGWYGATGIDPAGTTSLFLIGKGASIHDTQLIVGGRVTPFDLIGRDVIRVDIPAGVQTIPGAEACPPGAARFARSGLALVSAAEPLPAPVGRTFSLPPDPTPAGSKPALPVTVPLGDCCGLDCNHREMVAIHLATPYGVSGRLLVPVIPRAGGGGSPAFVSGCGFELFFSTAKSSASPTEAARVDEFYRSGCDSIEIAVPASFIPPEKGSLRLVLRDEARGVTAATFSFPNPFFDGSRGRYVIAGGDLRNFVGDTSRPATDKTLRGAVKPYLDALLATGSLAQDGDSVILSMSAEIVAGERAVPVSGSVPISATRRGKEPLELPAAAD